MGFCESGQSSFGNQMVTISWRGLSLFSFKISRQYKLSMQHIANFTHIFFLSHMWLKYKWFDWLICSDAINLPCVTSQQNYVSLWLPNLLLRSFPIMSQSQFRFSLFSTLLLPWGCSCANCFLHLCIQPKVLTLSVMKPRMSLPSMEPTLYLSLNSDFKELFCGQRYVDLFPFP